MPDLVTEETRSWETLAAQANITYSGTVVVRGPGARGVGDALLRLGSDRVIVDESPLGDAAAVSPRDDIVDAVVMLHAWAEPSAVDDAARTAVAWVRPGGAVVLCDLAVARLRAAPPSVFPAALLYKTHPTVADLMQGRSVSPVQLAMAGVRAGLDGKTLIEMTRPVAIVASPAEHREAVALGVWKGAEHLDDAERRRLADRLGEVVVGRWPLVEREPWIALAGRSRR